MDKRLKEIMDRKIEIRTLLKTGKNADGSTLDLETLKSEIETLNQEETEIRSRLDIANGINLGKIPSDIVPKPDDKKEDRKVVADIYDTVEYRKAFFNYVKTGKMAPEYRDVTTSSDAGAVIPTTTLNTIIDKLLSSGMILPLVTRTAYNTGLSIPVSSVKPTATWVADGATSPVQKKTTGSVVFGAYKLRCAVGVSLNLDAMALSAFEAAIANNIAEAMVIGLEQAIISGSGSGQPTGILTVTPTITPVSVSALNYKIMTTAEGLVPSAYENGSVYVMNKATYMDYIGIVDTNGQPIARTNYGIDGKTNKTLLGRDVIICDYLPSFDSAAAGATFAFIFRMKDYVLNTAFNVTLRQYEDYVTDDIVRKAIMLADGKVVDTSSLVLLQKPATK